MFNVLESRWNFYREAKSLRFPIKKIKVPVRHQFPLKNFTQVCHTDCKILDNFPLESLTNRTNELAKKV